MLKEIRHYLRTLFGKGNYRIFKDGSIRVKGYHPKAPNFTKWYDYGTIQNDGLIRTVEYF